MSQALRLVRRWRPNFHNLRTHRRLGTAGQRRFNCRASVGWHASTEFSNSGARHPRRPSRRSGDRMCSWGRGLPAYARSSPQSYVTQRSFSVSAIQPLAVDCDQLLPRYDVVVVGGGAVGSSMVAALRSDPETRKLNVLLIEKSPPAVAFGQPNTQDNPHHDLRVFALRPQCVDELRAAGIWPHMHGRFHAYSDMYVWQKSGNSSHLHLNYQDIVEKQRGYQADASQEGDKPDGHTRTPAADDDNALGYIVENGVLVNAAYARLVELQAQSDGCGVCHVFAPTDTHQLAEVVRSASLTDSDGGQLEDAGCVVLSDGDSVTGQIDAGLLIGAEGAVKSFVLDSMYPAESKAALASADIDAPPRSDRTTHRRVTEQQGPAVVGCDFPDTRAVVCAIRCQVDNPEMTRAAFQKYLPEGPLALLPLPQLGGACDQTGGTHTGGGDGPHTAMFSVVWTCTDDTATALQRPAADLQDSEQADAVHRARVVRAMNKALHTSPRGHPMEEKRKPGDGLNPRNVLDILFAEGSSGQQGLFPPPLVTDVCGPIVSFPLKWKLVTPMAGPVLASHPMELCVDQLDVTGDTGVVHESADSGSPEDHHATTMDDTFQSDVSQSDVPQSDADTPPVQHRPTGAVVIGDVGHSIHPQAGQGLNLGLIDAFSLQRALRDTVRSGMRLNASPTLNTWAAQREEEAAMFIGGVNAINDAFLWRGNARVTSTDQHPDAPSRQQPLDEWLGFGVGSAGLPDVLRSWGIGLLNNSNSLKKAMVEMAVGRNSPV